MLKNPLLQGALVAAAFLLILASCGSRDHPLPRSGLEAASATQTSPTEPATSASPYHYHSEAQRARWESASREVMDADAAAGARSSAARMQRR